MDCLGHLKNIEKRLLAAVQAGTLDDVKEIYREHPEMFNTDLCEVAALCGQLRTLQWLQGVVIQFDEAVVLAAIRGDDPDTIAWLMSDPRSASVVSRALARTIHESP